MIERRKCEESLLAHILRAPEIWHDLAVTAEYFTTTQCRKIHSAVESVVSAGDAVAIDSVYAADRTIDAGHLASLTTEIYPMADWRYYERHLITHHRRGKVQQAAQEALESTEEPEAIIARLDERITDMMRLRSTDRIYRAGELCGEYIETVEERYRLDGRMPGVPTGLASLDKYLLGWRESRLYVIGGRPSSGKSALLLNSAQRLAGKGVKVGLLSLESSRTEVMERMAAATSFIDSQKLAQGRMGPADFKDFNDAMAKIYELPFYLYDAPNQTLQQVKSQARRMVRVQGCRVVFVDYVQLIRVPGAEDRKTEVARASIELKDLARELQVPVVMAAQLTRDADERRPHLGNFQWSSQIEQDVDAAVLIWRRQIQTTSTIESGEQRYEYWLLVEKNRDGSTGGEQVAFVPHIVSFQDLDRRHE